MKAILKYDLPDDQSDYLQAVHASDMASALWEIAQYLRSQDKYDGTDTIEQIRENFYNILNDNDINLDKLII